ncbi:MAG: serine O-acetyltransferase EpsC [Erysipelotrichaceae bacterium]|nr:serine O-acetyltransferase EpsC [Erysipelotrichaceae bacterium]
MDNFLFEKVIDKKQIYQTLDELLYICHSDYFKNTVTEDDVMIIKAHLNKQIKMCLDLMDMDEEADKYSESFFERINEIKRLLDGDLQAIYDGDPAANSTMEIVLSYPGFYAISVYRIAHELRLLNVPLLPRIISEYAHSSTGIDINPGATIGENFFIDHGTGIVIGETCVIGKNVKLYQGVTLGALSTRGGQRLKGINRHPSIGDNVTIYAGASVLGPVHIGSNSTLGSNVFITSDVPENTRLSKVE